LTRKLFASSLFEILDFEIEIEIGIGIERSKLILLIFGIENIPPLPQSATVSVAEELTNSTWISLYIFFGGISFMLSLESLFPSLD
jgi:hypothetical protein